MGGTPLVEGEGNWYGRISEKLNGQDRGCAEYVITIRNSREEGRDQ